MALVRRAVAVGRAQVPGAAASVPQQAGAHQAGPAAGAAPAQAQPGHEMAAAVATLPAKGWAMVSGLGLTGVGALGAWNINQLMSPSAFQMESGLSVFAALFVFSAAVERILEPFTRWMPGRTQQERYEKAVADMENGVPGATNAAAHYKAAVDQARSSRAVLTWGLATLVATLLAAGSGFYLLRMLSTTPGWSGVDVWVDALVTGLVVGSGTKPLHDIINRVQNQATSPV